MAIDPFGIQPMLLHEQLSDLAEMDWGWWFKKLDATKPPFLSTKWWSPPKKLNNISWLFNMFPCFSRCLGRRCLTKFHINPASKKLPPTGLKCLLRRRMLCRFTSINGHLRGGDTVIGDDYCSISASKIAAPLSCTYLLFIDPSSVLCFSCFSLTSKHYGVQLGSWATKVYLWTCTWHMYAHVQTKWYQ